MLHSYPSAPEALAAVREWLLSGDVSFDDRVAAHLLGVVERELSLPTPPGWYAEQLAALGVASEAELAESIRSGARELSPELLAVLDALTTERLRATNPTWLAPVTDDDPRGGVAATAG